MCQLDVVGEIGVVFETRKTKGRKYENSKRLSPLGCCDLNSPTASRLGAGRRHGDRAACDVKTCHLPPTPFRDFTSRAAHTESGNEPKGE